MVRLNNMKIVFILVLFLSVFVFSQDKQVNDDKDKKLREEILAVYKSKGEQGLRDFVKNKKNKISNKFVVYFVEAGVKERKEEWLRICEIMAEEKKDKKACADVYLKIGEYFRLISDNKKASEYFDKAITIYIKLNVPVGQGNVYLRKGVIFYYKGDNERALEMYDKALPMFNNAGYTLGQSYVYLRKGDICFYTGDNSKALEMYDNALTFFEKTKDSVGQGNVYHRKGYIYFSIGDNSKAYEMYDKAFPYYEKAEDLIGQGNVYMSKGDIYLYTGDNSSALEMYGKALPFYEKSGDLIGQGNIYSSKGNTYFNTGDNSKALEMYDIALPFFEKAEFSLGQSDLYRGKGDVYQIIGEIPKAIEMYDKALTFFEKAGQPIGQGNVYVGKGNIYLRIGENSRAFEMYEKALPFFEKAGQPTGQANVYQSKGDIYLKRGENLKAIEMYDKALPLYEKAENLVGQGNIYLSQGDIYFDNGDNSKAFEAYDKALHFFEKVESPLGQGNVCQSKGNMYLYIGDNSRALDMYDKALAYYKKEGAIESESNALYGKAKVLVKLKKKAEPLELFEKFISNLEKVRTQTAFSEMKRTFMETVYGQYEKTALFMLDNKYYDKGFKYAESMKARVFLDRMGEGLVPLEKGLKPELRGERDKLVAKLSFLSKKMYETDAKEKKKLEELKKKYRKAQDEFEELLIKIRLENPLYASVRYPQPTSVHSLQKEVLKKREILVRYFITPDKFYVFLVSKKRFKVLPLEIKAEKIKTYVNRFLLAVKEISKGDMAIFGKKLYRQLFKPLEAELQGKRDIIIIPDSHLARIPFESFIIGEGKSGRPIFLLEKYRIKYIQSASLLSVLRKYYQRDREANNFIGFGDPVYDYDNFKQGKMEKGTHLRSSEKANEIKEIFRSRYARVGGLMNRLQGSGEEVRTIARLFENKSQKSLIYLREQATEDNAKAANLKEFDYIHFTCHGILEDEFQCLTLSQLPKAQSSEDGYFTLNEIMNCDYNSKLVVLSACQTGSGKMERAEGVTGLTRAVMYAGTPAVIASLWDVDDPATKDLMVTFYRNLLENNLDKVEALRQAKLELIKEKKYASPFFWSAFVMYGE